MHPTQITYWQNTYCFLSPTRIQSSGKDEKGFFIIPSSTIFYPGGGGQPMDIGYITSGKDECKIVGIDFNEGFIKHYLEFAPEELTADQEIAMRIDKENRLLAASLHTGGHWIAGIVAENLLLPLKPVKGYHYPDSPYVEFEGDRAMVNEEIIDRINAVIRTESQNDLKITATSNLSSNTVMPRRMVTIENYAAIGCGGTHVNSTSEIKDTRITKIFFKNGKIRIGYKV